LLEVQDNSKKITLNEPFVVCPESYAVLPGEGLFLKFSGDTSSPPGNKRVVINAWKQGYSKLLRLKEGEKTVFYDYLLEVESISANYKIVVSKWGGM